MLKFTYATPLRLQNVRSFKSSKGYELTFVKVVDTNNYESEEFMLSKDIQPDSLEVGTNYQATLEIDGKYSNLFLKPVK